MSTPPGCPVSPEESVSPRPAARSNLATSLAGPRPGPRPEELASEERAVALISAVIGYFLQIL
jgi:hypothetical protein